MFIPPIFVGPITRKREESKPYENIMPILNGVASLEAITKENMKARNNLYTTITLGSNEVCPGLGPSRVEDLHLVKEDISLNETIIVTNYASPRTETVKYGVQQFHLQRLS